jgi:hypothetical protein
MQLVDNINSQIKKLTSELLTNQPIPTKLVLFKVPESKFFGADTPTPNHTHFKGWVISLLISVKIPVVPQIRLYNRVRQNF